MRFPLTPTDDAFFALFNESAENVAQCARALQGLVTDFDNLPSHLDVVMSFESKGDELTSSILRRLNSTFVTPFDPEDIHARAEELDDVVDDMLAVAALLNIVHVEQPLPELKEQADLLVALDSLTRRHPSDREDRP